MKLVELDSTPGIKAGENFNIEVSFNDLNNNTGVIVGYVDVEFDKQALEVKTITYNINYNTEGKSGTISAGLVDEVGSIVQGAPIPGQEPNPNFKVPQDGQIFTLNMTAITDLTATTTQITTNKADDTNHVIAVLDPNNIGDQRDNAKYDSLTIGSNSPQPTVPTITIAATDAQASEQGPDTGEFTITRTGDTTAPLTVQYTIGGTAINGSDYNQLPASITILANAASATIGVIPIDDTLVDGSETETVLLTLVDGTSYDLGTTTSATVTIADNDSDVQPPTDFSVKADVTNGQVVYDASILSDDQEIILTLSDNVADLGNEATFDNLIGFYEVTDLNGGIDTNGDGVADLLPSDSGYAQAAIQGHLDTFGQEGIRAGSVQNSTVEDVGDIIIQGGKYYAPFVIANGGSVGFQGFIDLENSEDNGQFNEAATEFDDLVAYFSFIGANPDGVAHIQDRGNNIYGFEDLPSNLGVSDQDFNDAVFRFNFTV